MKRKEPIFSFAAFLFLIIGCSNPSKPFTERRIVIASKQTIKVPELNLLITNNGCGRKWISDGDKPAYETPFCGLDIKRDDITLHGGGDFKPIYIGNAEITIDKMNPWGAAEDSVPPGGCRVLVRQVEGR